MRRELGKFVCIRDDQVETDDSFKWSCGLFQRCGIYHVMYHHDLGSEPVYWVRLFPEDLTDQHEVRGCGLNEITFKTHFIHLRKAKLAKLNAICDAGPDS
jgi:hypothetical protein